MARLLRAMGIAGCFSASVSVGFEPDARGGSCLVCQRRSAVEENFEDMVVRPRVVERARLDSSANWTLRGRVQRGPGVDRLAFS